MTRHNIRTNRRTVLKTIGAGIGGLTVGTSAVSAQEQPDTDPIRRIPVDTSSYAALETATVEIHPRDALVVEATGSEVETSDRAFDVHVYDLRDPAGRPTPERAKAQVTPVQASVGIQNPDKGGGKSAASTRNDPSMAGTQSSVNALSDSPSIQAGDIDDSDEDNDFTQDYEGTVWTKMSNEVGEETYFDQATNWTASGGEVDSFNYHWCWQTVGQYSHLNNGVAEQNYDGSNAYSKLWCDFEYSSVGGSYFVYHRCSIDMEPDGQMYWWGRVYTRYVGSASLNAQFGYDYDYVETC